MPAAPSRLGYSVSWQRSGAVFALHHACGYHRASRREGWHRCGQRGGLSMLFRVVRSRRHGRQLPCGTSSRYSGNNHMRTVTLHHASNDIAQANGRCWTKVTSTVEPLACAGWVHGLGFQSDLLMRCRPLVQQLGLAHMRFFSSAPASPSAPDRRRPCLR